MSWVWTLMLSFSDEEWWEDGGDKPRDTCDPLERINDWMEHGPVVSLIEPTYADEAGYGMHANLYGGGFKHFDIEGFIKVVQAQNWKDRANVQLWINGDEEESFTPIELGERSVDNAGYLRRSMPDVRESPPPQSRQRILRLSRY